MIIFERIYEFGVMRSMGLKSHQLFVILVMESVYLAVIGIFLGCLMSVGCMIYFGIYGLDISVFSDAIKSLAMSSTLFPVYQIKYFMICSFGIIVVAVLSALYPGWKALKIEPVEALQYR